MTVEEEIGKIRAQLDRCKNDEEKEALSKKIKELLDGRISQRIAGVHKNVARLRAMGQKVGKGIDYQRNTLQTLKLAKKILDENETVVAAIARIDAMIKEARTHVSDLENALDVDSVAKVTELKNRLKNLEEARGILAY